MSEKRSHSGPSSSAARGDKELMAAFDSLSQRELQVLDLLARGLLSKEMAYQLTLSRRTIEGYRASVKRKVGARTSAELISLVASLDPPGLGE